VLAVGWSLLPPRQRLQPGESLATAPGQVALNGWVKLGADDPVTVIMSKSEMGQGVHTGLAMLLADELDADWDSVDLEMSPLDPCSSARAAPPCGRPPRCPRWHAAWRPRHRLLRG